MVSRYAARPMGAPILLDPLFDAVIFDLDGTLVATDRFWVQAARTGTRQALAQLGIERELPSAGEFARSIGLPPDIAFPALFPDLDATSLELVRGCCLEEERLLLERGAAALMPGARSTLEALKARGVRLGIASMCTGSYLERVIGPLRLDELVEEFRCLDSPGVADKAEMIEQELVAFGTRSAVMVGDRALDREAAWANGLPHIHCAFGRVLPDEGEGAEGVIEDLGELPDRLGARRRWIEAALERAGLFRSTLSTPFLLGITGPPLSGKGLFARDAARVLAEHAIEVHSVPLDLFRRAGIGLDRLSPEEMLAATFDVEALFDEVIEPCRRGEGVQIDRGALDREGRLHPVRIDAPPGASIVLEGPFLADPRLRSRIDRLIHLQAPEPLLLRRAAGREGRNLGLRPLERLRGIELPAHRDFETRFDPARLADLILDASNPLGA
jgi:phosphoglycolate phosphatase